MPFNAWKTSADLPRVLDQTAKPATPKMHRRISARIGQFIDTKFGDKKTPGEGKKEKAVKKDDEATSSSSSEEEGEGKVAKVKKSKKSKGKKEVKEVEEAKKDEVPVVRSVRHRPVNYALIHYVVYSLPLPLPSNLLAKSSLHQMLRQSRLRRCVDRCWVFWFQG